MEIGKANSSHTHSIGFKIDLIVWKSVKFEDLRELINKFKIDLIVWKYITCFLCNLPL